MKPITFFLFLCWSWVTLIISAISVFFNFFTRVEMSVNDWLVWLFSTSTIFILLSSFEPVKSLVMEGEEKTGCFFANLKHRFRPYSVDSLYSLPIIMGKFSRKSGLMMSVVVLPIRLRILKCEYVLTVSIRRGIVDPFMSISIRKGRCEEGLTELLISCLVSILKTSFTGVLGKFEPEIVIVPPIGLSLKKSVQIVAD